MKTKILIKHLDQHLGQEVILEGWLYNKRSSGKIAFLEFRDGTGTIQAVVTKSAINPKIWQHIQSVTFESSVSLSGIVKRDPRAPTGFELELSDFHVLSLAPDDYPIGKKEHGVDFLLQNRHLWLRSPKQQAIQHIRYLVFKAILDFYDHHDFVKIDTPIITPNACEGTTTLFELDYFGEPGFLSQSGQLYLEAALPAFNRVFDFSPVFRAEKSKTRRHLIEFWMTNAEAAFVDHHANLKLQEELIGFVIKSILNQGEPYLHVLERNPQLLAQVTPPFDRISHHEAVKFLRRHGSQITLSDDLGSEDETLLTQGKDKPVFVELYPAKVKAFYMKRLESNPQLVKCADLIAPEGHGEIIGGSERETDYDTLLASINKHQLALSDFSWYLDLRRYGSVPHSGFGIGLERLVKWICNLPHVRETIPFPRLLHRLRP